MTTEQLPDGRYQVSRNGYVIWVGYDQQRAVNIAHWASGGPAKELVRTRYDGMVGRALGY